MRDALCETPYGNRASLRRSSYSSAYLSHNCSRFLLAGIVIICTAIVGLSFDLGRMFIVKAELQAYADSAAIFAAIKLDGTRDGIDRANTAATSGSLGAALPNKVNMVSETITGVTATYATTYNGTYDSYSTARSNATNSYRFVRVTAASPTRLYLLPIINVFANSANSVAYRASLSASATGGQSGFLHSMARSDDSGENDRRHSAGTKSRLDDLTRRKRYLTVAG
jgi:uncharacterized membrane protein